MYKWVFYSVFPNVIKFNHYNFETQRRCHQKFKTGYQWLSKYFVSLKLQLHKLLFLEGENIFFYDIKETYFKAYCENVEDIYKRGLDIDDHKIEENLKYPKPKRPKSYSDQQNLLLLSDKEDCNHVRKLLDKFKCSGVWVCIIKFFRNNSFRI